ncbi:hypothetical protein BDZ45DRAFT_809815 [Acephala macrosclerotiorum]|nr:hypothetical protein BDZ45DRAFT_809815 [Acephala macrosclerotiorum]
MRLLKYNNDGEFSLTKDFVGKILEYAILSHTWGADTEEVTYRDLVDGTGKNKYSKILDEVSSDLPAQLQAKLDDVRQELPRLFRSSYPMVLQRDDLLENNLHVDEATGHITGKCIIDWADAKITPFGVSLANMEVVLGIQTEPIGTFTPTIIAFGNYFG